MGKKITGKIPQKNLPGKAKKPQNPNFGKTPKMAKGGIVKKCMKKGGSVND